LPKIGQIAENCDHNIGPKFDVKMQKIILGKKAVFDQSVKCNFGGRFFLYMTIDFYVYDVINLSEKDIPNLLAILVKI
jgi:hypothetical protein